MPAITPRMHVTPTQTSYALLRELQALTGKAPATITRELLEEAIPALEMAVEAFRMLKERPQQAMAAVDRMLDSAVQEVTQARLELDKAMKKKPGRKPAQTTRSGGAAASPRKKQGQGAANTG